MCSAADDPTQHDAMNIEDEALPRYAMVGDLNDRHMDRADDGEYVKLADVRRLVPAEDEGRLPCTCRPFFDGHVTGHPDCPRGRAEDEGRLLQLARLERFIDFRDPKHPQYVTANGIRQDMPARFHADAVALRAALAATPEPR